MTSQKLVKLALVLLLAVFVRHSAMPVRQSARAEPAEVLIDRVYCFPLKRDPTFLPPVFISAPKPKYTVEAIAEHRQGVITVQVMVGKDGKASAADLSKSLGFDLNLEAIHVADAARFKPARSHGHPVVAPSSVDVDFRLPQDVASH
jgi:TonB family protein